eukprot:CAMPEP_0173179938 /NCGR_PEP_ID=MMETSP1141-20130122/6420_1 /TAXON_ID=483371 /ORGANISM="non described non described, Strain CCMP2298" /LENGTH=80 /DNA_ID=CAMNT_0014102697 /DNA_START=343 /DNA_END=586 /DNA_ORIENTATION=-
MALVIAVNQFILQDEADSTIFPANPSAALMAFRPNEAELWLFLRVPSADFMAGSSTAIRSCSITWATESVHPFACAFMRA